MTTLEEFNSKLEEEFDELEPGNLKTDVPFADQVDWNSVNALIVMAHLKTEYGVDIKVKDLQEVKTVAQLFDYVKRIMVL